MGRSSTGAMVGHHMKRKRRIRLRASLLARPHTHDDARDADGDDRRENTHEDEKGWGPRSRRLGRRGEDNGGEGDGGDGVNDRVTGPPVVDEVKDSLFAKVQAGRKEVLTFICFRFVIIKDF